MVKISRPVISGTPDKPISNTAILYLFDTGREQLFATYYEFKASVKNWELTIPQDSVTNFLSVPRFFRPLVRFFISPIDRHLAIPSIIHDYLVSEWTDEVFVLDTTTNTWTKGKNVTLTWKEAAEIFPDYCDVAYPGSKTAWIKSRLARFLICGFGLFQGKLNKPIKSE